MFIHVLYFLLSLNLENAQNINQKKWKKKQENDWKEKYLPNQQQEVKGKQCYNIKFYIEENCSLFLFFFIIINNKWRNNRRTHTHIKSIPIPFHPLPWCKKSENRIENDDGDVMKTRKRPS